MLLSFFLSLSLLSLAHITDSFYFWELFLLPTPLTKTGAPEFLDLALLSSYLLSDGTIFLSFSELPALSVINSHICISSTYLSLSLKHHFQFPSVVYIWPKWRAGTLDSVCYTKTSLFPFSLTFNFSLSVIPSPQ